MEPQQPRRPPPPRAAHGDAVAAAAPWRHVRGRSVRGGSTEASLASLRCVTFSQVPSPLGKAIVMRPRSCL
eukprot:1859704-Pyramimonas_sp.AAC.1